MAKHAQRTIIVLGMHRSGTSALTGSLQEAGLHLGDVSVANPGNAKGNRESQVVMKLHERLFAINGGSWDQPPAGRIVWDEPSCTEMRAFIASFHDRPIWGFKDPRTLFVLDGWLRELPHAEFVGIFRDPREVARSLHRRNGMAHAQAYTVWHRYNSILLQACTDHRFPIVEFTPDPAEFATRCSAVLDHLGLAVEGRDTTFYDPALIAAPDDVAPTPPADVVRLLHDLRALSIGT